jgi:hypothetical protein
VMLHKAERRTATIKTVRETEAEATAFVVGKTIGLSTGRVSADYFHLYHGNAALLAESLEIIQKTSAVILFAGSTSSGHHNNRSSRRRSRTRTGASQLTLLFPRAGGLMPSAQTPPARPNPLKESSHEY